jgi:hypothetical protein
MHSRVKVRLPPNLKTKIDKEFKDGLTPIFENALRSRAHQPRSPCSGKPARGSAPLTRLLPQRFDALFFAAGIGLTSRNGGNRHPALSKKMQGKEALMEGLARLGLR